MSKKPVKQPAKNNMELKDYTETLEVKEKIGDISEEDMAKINKLTVKALKKTEVVVYQALLIDDQVTRNNTKYPAEFQKMLLSLPVGEGNFVGSTFLLGALDDHQETASSQLGRVFDAWQVTDEKGHIGVMGRIYILKEGNDETIGKIDAGVLKEVSIATKVEMPMCSVCGQDIRECKHVRGENGCHVIMTGKGFLGETSLVAIPGSAHAKILNADNLRQYARVESLALIENENVNLKAELVTLRESLTNIKSDLEKITHPETGLKDIPDITGITKTGTVIYRLMSKVGNTAFKAAYNTLTIDDKINTVLIGEAIAALTKSLEKTAKVTAKSEFDVEDMEVLTLIGIAAEGAQTDFLTKMADIDITTLQQAVTDYEKDVALLLEALKAYKETDAFMIDEEGSFGIVPQPEQRPSVETIKQSIKIAGTLNEINTRVVKANEKIIKYAAKYLIEIAVIPTKKQPVPPIDEGLKEENVNFLTDIFFRAAEILDSNLKKIEAVLKYNTDLVPLVYDGDITEIEKAVLFTYTRLENILERIYELEGRFNLEDEQKAELIKETLRVGTLANVIKVDKKEDVEKLLTNMSLSAIKNLKDAWFTEGSVILGENKEIKTPEELKEKKEVPKSSKPVNVMDYKEKPKN